MVKLNFDDEDGVWRTIGGRRVFIRNGQSMSDAMKKSGKFKSAKKKEKNPIEEMANDRIKDKENTLANDRAMVEGMKRKGLDEVNGWKREDYENRIKKNEEYLKNTKGLTEEGQKEHFAGEELYSDDPNRFGDKLRQINEKMAKEQKESGKRVEERYKKENKNTTSNYRNKITDVAKNSKEDNVTLDVETGKPVSFEKGYSVSFQQSTDNYSDEEYHAKVEECRDKCDGKVYAGKYGGDAEASFHTDSLDDAKELMYKYNQESIYDWQHDTLIMNDKYDSSKNKTNYKAETTNEYMNDKIRNGASKNKNKDDLPKKTEIKTQGTSNRKEVSENIQAHILEYYDKPEDFVQQMDAMDYLPTKWHSGEELAKGGSYLIYYDDQRDFLDSLKINPKGKEFSDDRVFQTYTSLIGRESAKLYERLEKNAYKKYLKEHPNSNMSFSDYKDMRKGGR